MDSDHGLTGFIYGVHHTCSFFKLKIKFYAKTNNLIVKSINWYCRANQK